MISRPHAGPAGALTTRTPQVNTAAIFQLLQDARGLLGHDQGTAMSVLARASHLLGVSGGGCRSALRASWTGTLADASIGALH
jgi:hypothetical protein